MNTFYDIIDFSYRLFSGRQEFLNKSIANPIVTNLADVADSSANPFRTLLNPEELEKEQQDNTAAKTDAIIDRLLEVTAYDPIEVRNEILNGIKMPKVLVPIIDFYSRLDPRVRHDIEAQFRAFMATNPPSVQVWTPTVHAEFGDRIGDMVESLDLSNLQSIRDNFQRLSELFPNLKKLNVTNCRLVSLPAGSVKVLEELDATLNRDLGVHPDVECMSLKRLVVDDSGYADRYLHALPTAPNLERLSIRGGVNHPTQWTRPLASLNTRFPKLTHLNIGACQTLTKEALVGLEAMKNLKELDVSNCPRLTPLDVARLRAKHKNIRIIA